MLQKVIEINSQKIAYYESEGTGQPVLFVHGNSMSGLSFEKQLISPLGEQYRFVALDLPGHGRSAHAQNPEFAYHLPAYAETVAGFAAALDMTDALLVGWSLGGHVLLEASSRLPAAVGLMILGTPPVGKPMAADAFIPNPLMPLLFKSDLSSEEAAALTDAFFKPDTRLPGFFYEDMKRTDGRVRESLGLSIMEGNYSDEVTVVATINKPLAIVHGAIDPFINSSYIKGLGIPTLWRGEVQIIPDAGHTPHWEQPAKFNSLLREFILECNR